MNQIAFGHSASPAQPRSTLSRDMTQADLSSHLGLVAGRGGLNIQFFYAKTRIECADVALNGTYQTRLCVAKMPKGDRLTIATRFISEEQAAAMFPREFAMFKQYEDVPTDGTPLYELPGISQSQIAMLTVHNLRSIEDLAGMAIEHINGMGLDARSAHKLAVRWLASKTDNADLIAKAKAETATTEERDALLRRLDAAERANLELQGQVKVLMMQGGMAQPAQPAQGGTGAQAIAVESREEFPEPRATRLFEGGMVDGNDDLDANDPQQDPEDPLDLKRSRRR